jgi:DNA modification methylase
MRILADARTIPLQSGSVQCVVTSPPYWGLRDYGIAGQLGLEPTPDAYVAALVGVFREVWRVLRDDGTLWLNLGDSYGARGGDTMTGFNERYFGKPSSVDKQAAIAATFPTTEKRTGLKPKDLVGIPWRVAFALQADGWYLRSDIIWAKPNPMPESVTDRPTKAHEYVFLLTKRERYYYDAEAISECSVSPIKQRTRLVGMGQDSDAGTAGCAGNDGARNARTVWTINPKPYAEAHFATMPEKLAERCIKAGSKPGDLVLDPFGGSGTIVKVARSLNRRGVMLDLNPAYLDLAKQRNANLQLSLLETEATA